MTETLTDEMRKLMDEAIDSMAKEIILERKSTEEVLRYMLRHQVVPPIKGEITKGKIRWRGLKIIYLHPGDIFMGIEQRGRLITPDWHMMWLRDSFEECLLFGVLKLEAEYEEAKHRCHGGIWDQIVRENDEQ